MENVWIALIVAVGAIVSPVLLAFITQSQRRREKAEDYARQDMIAAQVAEAARLLVDRQDVAEEKAAEAARLLVKNTAKVEESAKITIEKLDVIHTLVNSNMTTAMQNELDATVRELAMMREVVALNKTAGREPSVDALAAIKSTEDKISELKVSLADRVEQTKIADQKITTKHN